MPFSDIFGHDREIDILRRAIASGRVAHSFLFAGPDGVGKRFAAFAVAKSLNCVDLTGDFCGVCRNCVDIEKSAYGDVLLVEPREPDYKGGGVDHISGVIKIEAVREAQQRLSLKSSRGGKKLCIVDGADKMNREAANAFLKTLEEPPPDSVIILIVSDGASLLPTIISRCQRIKFRPLERGIVKALIVNKRGLTGEEAGLAAALSGGSIGRALNLDMADAVARRNLAAGIMQQISAKDVDGLFKAAEDMAKCEDPVGALEFLKMWYRDAAVVMEGKEEMAVNADILPELKADVKRQSFERLASGYRMINRAQLDIMPPRYANKQLTIENLLMQL